MDSPSNGDGRDQGNAWVRGLLTGAGASMGRVLDERQVHAVSLALEVFAYLLAALQVDKIDVRDVIHMIKFYSQGVDGAKSEQG
jgi:hypothetical protein